MSERKKAFKSVKITFLISAIVIIAVLVAIKVISIKTGEKSTDITNHQADSSIDVPEDETEEDEAEVVDPTADPKYYATYETEKYETKNQAGEVSVINERNIITLTNAAYPKAATLIQQALRSTMDDEWNNDLKRAADDYSEAGSAGHEVGVTYKVNLEYQNENFVTFSITMTGGYGGVGWTADYIYSFDAKTGERIGIDTCTEHPDQLISTLVQATKKVMADNNYPVQDTRNEGEDSLYTQSMSKEGCFGILEDGIHVKHQKYEISGGSSGVIDVTLDKTRSNSLLKENYKIK
jgi:cell division protein FtsL